jgi:phage FluMu protein Com
MHFPEAVRCPACGRFLIEIHGGERVHLRARCHVCHSDWRIEEREGDLLIARVPAVQKRDSAAVALRRHG